MKQKILAFIYNGKKFLALHSEPHPEHGKGGWFVVTGGIENNESSEDAVIREVKEDIGVSFSLDGFQSHNDLTRIYPSRNSTYGDVMTGINLLKKYGRKTFPITVVTKYNVEDLPGIVDEAKKQEFPCIQLTPVEPLGVATADLSPNPSVLAEKLIAVYDRNFQSALNGEKFRVRNLGNLLATFFAPTIPNSCSTCGVNKLQVLGVDVNGDLYPCDMWFGRKDYSMGNIKDLSIKDALNSDKNFRNYRKVSLIENADDFSFISLHTGGCPANAYGRMGNIFTTSFYAETFEKVYAYLASQMPFLIKNKLIDFFLRNERKQNAQ